MADEITINVALQYSEGTATGVTVAKSLISRQDKAANTYTSSTATATTTPTAQISPAGYVLVKNLSTTTTFYIGPTTDPISEGFLVPAEGVILARSPGSLYTQTSSGSASYEYTLLNA